MYFPLLGRTRDFNPLDNTHAGRTKKAHQQIAVDELF